jgi:hypothetical protein
MTNHAEHEKKSDLPPEPERRPYQAPRLTVYGTIRELTQASFREIPSDNSAFPPNGSNM